MWYILYISWTYLVIKTLAYFPFQCALNSKPVLGAVLSCLKQQGIEIQQDSMTSDAALIWSVLWNGRMQSNKQVYQHYRSQNKPVIIIEIGALNRGVTWKVSVNNVTSQGYYGHLDDLDYDRPGKLNIKLINTKNASPEVVIALQHTKSLQLESIPDINQWISCTIQMIKNNTDRPIVIRPHPRCQIPLPAIQSNITIQLPRPISGSYDSFDMQYNCHAVVNYNSGPGVQAAISGVRPIVDITSLAYPVAINFEDLEKTYDNDRESWLVQICHTEYTLDELKNGLWLKRIAPALV